MTKSRTMWNQWIRDLVFLSERRPRRAPRPRRKWSIERLESRTLLATFTLPGGSTAATGADYFAIEQNNALDYTEAQNDLQAGADDRVNAGLDDPGLTSTSVSGGTYNYTTNGGGLVNFLHPGFFDNGAAPGAPRTTGMVPEEKSGESIPIDTSLYFRLNMMITADGVPDPSVVGGAAVQANIQWYDGRIVATLTATHAFFVFPGTNIYSFDLSTMDLDPGAVASGAWTGNMSGLRVYPSNYGTPVTMHIDWVTLTGAGQASLPVSISGAAGNVQVGLSTDGNPANLIKVVNPSTVGVDDINLFTVRKNLVAPAAQASVTSIDTTILGAGTYFLHALDASGNVLSGTTAQQITVNGIPQLTVLQPDNRGDESSDFATTYRSLSGAADPWDFSQTSDFSVATVSGQAAYYGAPTIVSNPVTTIGGTLSGNWMRYDTSTATGGAAAIGDTQFLLPLTGLIDVSRYTNLTIRTLLDRTRDIAVGPSLRVGWSTANPPAADLSNFVQSESVIIEQGLQELHLDLSTLKIDGQSPSPTTWPATSPAVVQYLRIDPHEYTSVTTAYFDQILLTRNDRTTSGVFNVTWSTADANVGQTITVSKIYLDTDRNRGNGKGTAIATNEANDGSFTFDMANFPALADGTYFVLLEFTDGVNTSSRYSSGKLDVSRLDLTAAFTLPGGSTAPTGSDYFAIEQNNALDYTEAQNNNQSGADDRINVGLDDTGLTSTSVSSGNYNFATAGAGLVFLLHPGHFDGEAPPGAPRTAGVVPEEKSGESIPIDASRYFQLNVKITADGVPDPSAGLTPAVVQGNIQWYDGRDISNTASRSFFVFPGTNIYSFNLSTISTAGVNPLPWSGMISGLRLFPSSSTTAYTMHIDWATLTGAGQASLPVSITGTTGSVQLGLSTDGDPTHLVKLIKPTGNTDNDFLYSQRNLVPLASQASITSIDTTILGSGTYFLHALDAGGKVLAGTSATQIVVNAIPRLTVLQPDNRGDEATDYATLSRAFNLNTPSQTADPWDFSQLTDFSVPFTPPETSSTYGIPTIVTNPTTTIGGLLSGDWMRYDNTTATGAGNSAGDPHFLLPLNPSLDTSLYRNLTIKLLLDRTRDISTGSVLRVMWSRNNPLLLSSDLTQSDDVIVQQGVQELHLDLGAIKIEPLSDGFTPWLSASQPLIRYLRIDPHEYSTATTAYFDQILLTRNDSTNNGVFNITWSATDANVGDPLTVSAIYLDTDKNSTNGKGTLLSTSEANDGTFTFNTASFPGLVAGSYYVLMEFTDGRNNSYRYSTGKLDVDPPATPGNHAPVLNNAGAPYVVAAVGDRLPATAQTGILISSLLATGAGGNPISDADVADLRGIALTGVDQTFGTWQYTLVASPLPADWINVEFAGAVSNASALLLPADSNTRVRFVTTLVPYHGSTVAAGHLPTETTLAAGLTFRAWDRTIGTAGGRGDTRVNGGSTAFSTATETAATYFEARLWRTFNDIAKLNTYTLELEAKALMATFPTVYLDRSTESFSGFTILMSPIPGVPTAPLYRMYFGIAFDSPSAGIQTDMGYRYLTTSVVEAAIIETYGPADRRAQRDGAYFRELGVNGGTGIMAYIYTTQQPGTTVMSQIYRTDLFAKDTRTGPPGTPATGSTLQQHGDHVYTTKTIFEMTQTPGRQHIETVPGVVEQTGWRQETVRGFVRELSPNISGATGQARSAPVHSRVAGQSAPDTDSFFPDSSLPDISADSRLALPSLIVPSRAEKLQIRSTTVHHAALDSTAWPIRRSLHGFLADHSRVNSNSAPAPAPAHVMDTDFTTIDVLFSRWDELSNLLSTP